MNAKKTLYLSISLLLSSPIVASEGQIVAPAKSKEQIDAIRKGIWAKVVKASPIKKNEELDHVGQHKMITSNNEVFSKLCYFLAGFSDSQTLAKVYADLDSKENESLRVARSEYAKYLALSPERAHHAALQANKDEKHVMPSAQQLSLTKRSQDYVNAGSRFWRYAKGTTQPVKFHVDGLSCHAAHTALKQVPAIVSRIQTAVQILNAKTEIEVAETSRVETLLATLVKNKPYIDKLSALEKEIAAQGLQLNPELLALVKEISDREASRYAEYADLVEQIKTHEIEQRKLELEKAAATQTKTVESMLSSMVIRNIEELKKAQEANK